nr:fructosamine kinase family protein [Mangrovicoccus ximenensis]
MHGGLRSGNIHFPGAAGVLIDPACNHRDAEIRLAMQSLFGRIPAAFP